MFSALLSPFRGDAAVHWRRLAVGLWAAILIGSCVRCVVGRAERNVGLFVLYADAGAHWRAGADLYPKQDSWDSFLYSPVIAAALVPYSLLPLPVGNVLWRLTLGGVYLYALWRWARLALPQPLPRAQQALLFLLVLPVTATTMLDGQAGALVAAATLLAVAAAAEEHWWQAAAWATVGVLLKAYPIALLLLLVVAYPRRAALPAAGALLIGFALPFALQRPAYVADQYVKWVAMMAASDRQTWIADIANRDLALLFRTAGHTLSQPAWLTAQLGAAAAAAGLCFAARRAAWPRQQVLLLVQALAVCWMTLFGPAVESFTYILVGPTLAWAMLEAWQERRPVTYRGLLVASWLIFTSATLAIVVMHSMQYHRLGPHPLAGLLLLVVVLADAGRRFRRGTAVAAVPADVRRAA